MLILRRRPAMDKQNHRRLRPRRIPHRHRQQSMRIVPVFRLRLDVLSRRNKQRRHQRIVMSRQLAQLPVFQRIHLIRRRVRRPQQRRMPARFVDPAHHAASLRQPLHLARAIQRNLRRILLPVFRNIRQHRLPIRRQHRRSNPLIQLRSQHRRSLRRPTRHGNHGHLPQVIDRIMRRCPLAINYVLPIRSPGQWPRIRSQKRRQLARSSTRPGIHHKHIRIRNAVRFRRGLVAHKRNHLPIRTPNPATLAVSRRPIRRPIRQLRQFLRRHVEQKKMRLLVRQKSFAIFLEMKPVNHNRLRRLGLRALIRLRLILLCHRQQQRLAIGRPLEPAQVFLHIRQLLRLATAPVQHPHLRSLRLALASRRERQPLPIRTPLRPARSILAERQLHILLAIPAHHPQLVRAFVLAHIHLAHRIRDPRPIRRHLRITHAL